MHVCVQLVPKGILMMMMSAYDNNREIIYKYVAFIQETHSAIRQLIFHPSYYYYNNRFRIVEKALCASKIIIASTYTHMYQCIAYKDSFSTWTMKGGFLLLASCAQLLFCVAFSQRVNVCVRVCWRNTLIKTILCKKGKQDSGVGPHRFLFPSSRERRPLYHYIPMKESLNGRISSSRNERHWRALLHSSRAEENPRWQQEIRLCLVFEHTNHYFIFNLTDRLACHYYWEIS